MFTSGEREGLKAALIDAAADDPLVSSAALFGSSAEGAEDDWSDLDLGLGVVEGGEVDSVIGRWTGEMYGRHGAVHHLDLTFDGILYRVFLLADTLQVDLSFWPAGSLHAFDTRFDLLFGSAGEADLSGGPTVEFLAGMSWLHLLHARSSIARRRELQAQFWLHGARDQILALACASRGLATNEARGADALPEDVKSQARDLLVRSSDWTEAERILGGLIDMLRVQLLEADASLGRRLDATLAALPSLRRQGGDPGRS